MVMPVHKTIYMRDMGCGEDDVLVCDCEKGFNPDCEYIARDVHHVDFKSEGGKDELKNLVAVSGNCHTKSHGKKGGNKHKFKAMWKRQIKIRTKLLERIPL